MRVLVFGLAALGAYMLYTRRLVVRIKDGVVLALSLEMAHALPKIEAAFLRATGREMVITSARDSHQSKPLSLHNSGNAIDLRVKDPRGAWTLSSAQIQRALLEIRAAVGTRDFDTIFEQRGGPTGATEDHIHIEYQPLSAGGAATV